MRDRIREMKLDASGAQDADVFLLGLVRKPSKWKWIDGDVLKKDDRNFNWHKRDGTLDASKSCAGIVAKDSKTVPVGKWWEVSCEAKNRFACQSGEF